MRKIYTHHEKEKKQKRNQWILAGFLILIMFGSVFGIIVNSFGANNNSDLDKVSYNGYDFTSQNGFWSVTIEDYEFLFKYNPEQVEKITNYVDNLNKYSGKPLYISSEDYIAEVEIYRNMGNFVERFQSACLDEKNCKDNLPVKNCSNNFIIIREANESKLIQNENCVFIEGKKENLTQITDEFIFKVLEIEQ